MKTRLAVYGLAIAAAAVAVLVALAPSAHAAGKPIPHKIQTTGIGTAYFEVRDLGRGAGELAGRSGQRVLWNTYSLRDHMERTHMDQFDLEDEDGAQ